jgi:limonene-1,2-epoxide hydrolase
MPARPNLFADIDSMEPDRFAAHLAEDVAFTFGNADTVHGRENVRDVWAGFCETVDGVSHELVEQFESGNATIAEARVTYTTKKGDKVTLPVVTIYRSSGELIDDYRIYMDLAPLLSAA